jgi:Putative peptidoglycan binding domain
MCAKNQLLIVALSFLLALPSYAADSDNRYSAKSVATLGCENYLAARQEGGEQYLLYGGYLGGYLTAYNQYVTATFDVTAWESVDTLAKLVANYCIKHPEENFGVALTSLFRVLQMSKLEQASESVPIQNGEHSMVIYRETLERVQRQLADAGLFQGEALGVYDDATRLALEAFQQANELPLTGVPDQTTLFFLYYR